MKIVDKCEDGYLLVNHSNYYTICNYLLDELCEFNNTYVANCLRYVSSGIVDVSLETNSYHVNGTERALPIQCLCSGEKMFFVTALSVLAKIPICVTDYDSQLKVERLAKYFRLFMEENIEIIPTGTFTEPVFEQEREILCGQ